MKAFRDSRSIVVRWASLLLLLGGGCDLGSGPEPPATGLSGLVLRGPVVPVCREDVPCDAPFAADFAVLRATRRLATFSTDATGRFEIRLSVGSYQVAPERGAPVMPGQVVEVEVRAGGLTPVVLQFDTGIR